MGQDENYDKLLQAVNQQASLDRDKVLVEARQQVRQIQARAKTQIEQIQSQIQVAAQQEILLERDRLLGQSRMASRLAHQGTRVRLLKKAFTQAKEALADLPGSPHYRDILGALMAEALTVVGPDSLIKVAVCDEKLCRAWISQHKLGCTVQAIDADAGTVLAFAADGDRQVDNSLATRLARVESLCQQEVAVILFQDALQNRGPV